jgi:hypothetical protein
MCVRLFWGGGGGHVSVLTCEHSVCLQKTTGRMLFCVCVSRVALLRQGLSASQCCSAHIV